MNSPGYRYGAEEVLKSVKLHFCDKWGGIVFQYGCRGIILQFCEVTDL